MSEGIIFNDCDKSTNQKSIHRNDFPVVSRSTTAVGAGKREKLSLCAWKHAVSVHKHKTSMRGGRLSQTGGCEISSLIANIEMTIWRSRRQLHGGGHWPKKKREKKSTESHMKKTIGVPGALKQKSKIRGPCFSLPEGLVDCWRCYARSHNIPQVTGRNSAVGSVCQRFIEGKQPFTTAVAGQSSRVVF